MTIGNDTYKIPKRLKINEGLFMIPDTHKIFNHFNLVNS
jgi:hypothetical protein